MSEEGVKIESATNNSGYREQPGYIVVKEEFEDEPLELELEEDGNLRMSTLISQFSGACGLRFRNKGTGAMRGVRLHNDLFLPPNGADGWPTDVIFQVVYRKDVDHGKRPSFVSENGGAPLLYRKHTQKPSDLAVLSLPWRTTENELKTYFSRFGTVVFANIKKDPETGNSRGFGFIRFDTYDAQQRAMEQTNHEIEGRSIVLRLTKKGENHQFRKVFVGRLTTELSRNDLLDYFSQFGQITEITIPQPFRSFAFITFQESSDAISILDQDHLIKGVSVVTRSADPIHDQKNRNPTTNQSDFQNTERTNARTTQYQPTATTAHLTEANQTTPNPEIMQQVQHAMSQIMAANMHSRGGNTRYTEDPFRTYPTRASPSSSPSGGISSAFAAFPNTPRNYSGNGGLVQPSSAAMPQNGVRERAARRGSQIRDERNHPTTGWNSPWDNANDPQSKIHSFGKSWL